MLKLPPPGNEHYQKDSRSCPLSPDSADGIYVYVQDPAGTIFLIRDERKHQHVTILGGQAPVKYAGDMEIRAGRVRTVTNCSGTFQFSERDGLREVAVAIRKAGLEIEAGGVRLFSWDALAIVEVLE